MTTTTTALPTGTWHLDTSATTITVSVKKMGMFTVPATLAVTSGSIGIDEKHEVESVEIVADAGSYASKSAKRNEHVSSADFLDSENFPTIVFRADGVTPASDGFQATGTVIVKGQSAPIDVQISDVDVSDGHGSFSATATVDRTAIGVDKLPTFIIGRELQITVAATATY